MSTPAVVGLVVLAVADIAATRPPAQVAGRPTFDRAQPATFPYPHLVITRDGQDAVLMFETAPWHPRGH